MQKKKKKKRVMSVISDKNNQPLSHTSIAVLGFPFSRLIRSDFKEYYAY